MIKAEQLTGTLCMHDVYTAVQGTPSPGARLSAALAWALLASSSWCPGAPPGSATTGWALLHGVNCFHAAMLLRLLRGCIATASAAGRGSLND